jgi:hypothetical protein
MKPPARLLALVLLGVLVFASGTLPAAAAAPERSESVLQGTQVLAHCNGFDVIDQYNVTVVTTQFFDQSGAAVEIHLSLQGTDTDVRSDTGTAIVHLRTSWPALTGRPSSISRLESSTTS